MTEVGVGGMAPCVGPKLGKRVPCGAGFNMNVNVEESMRRSMRHGVREVDFSKEVREHVSELESPGSCQVRLVLC